MRLRGQLGVRKESGKGQVPGGWHYSGDFENRKESRA